MRRHTATAIAISFVLSFPATAATDDEIETLFDALRIPELMRILRDEGLSQAADISEGMFPDRSGGWSVVAAGIYNPGALSQEFRLAFGNALADDDITPLIEFFTSDTGAQIVDLELSARTAMLDPETEDAAIAAYDDLADEDPERARQIEAFVAANDLIELNVMGGLNSSLAFYNGLVDGGAFEMSQDEILGTVWSQEDDIRSNAAEWLFGYLGLAYGPLENEQLDAYIAMSESDAGSDLNRALFAGYDSVFNSVSYNLGAAAARFAKGEDI